MSSPSSVPNPRTTYHRLLSYTLNYWKVLLLSIAAMVLVALSQPGFAALMKPMLNGGFIDKDPEVIQWLPFAVIGVFLVRAISGFISEYGMAWIGRQIIMELRDQMFTRLMLLPSDFYDQNSTGNMIAKFTFDVEQLAQAATTSITIMIRDVLMIISLIGWMFYLNAKLASVFLILGPLIAFLISLVSKRFRKISKRIQGSMGQLTHVLEEASQAQRVVKIFGGQNYEKKRFHDGNQNNRKQQVKLFATTSISTSIIQIIVAFALAGIIYAATQEGLKNNIDAGDFMSFMTAMMMLFAPLKRLTNITSILQKGIAAAESVFELLDTKIETDEGNFSTPRAEGRLAFNNVSFSYASSHKPALQNIKLNIEAGKTIAFVGTSGSGKSTLVNLLPRLYDGFEGEILLDGHDIRDYQLNNLRDQISYVGQDIVLFNDTLAHNIAYGRLEDTSEEDIIRAAKAAYAYDFIIEKKDGLQTMVGEKGVMLSGGQRQRIAIARALLKNAPILIMDEATSALDTESERYIQAALEELIKNRTTLIIAHRLSTIENADLIVVMSEGKIVETGDHVSLLSQNGRYAALHKMQFSDDSANANIES